MCDNQVCVGVTKSQNAFFLNLVQDEDKWFVVLGEHVFFRGVEANARYVFALLRKAVLALHPNEPQLTPFQAGVMAGLRDQSCFICPYPTPSKVDIEDERALHWYSGHKRGTDLQTEFEEYSIDEELARALG